MDAVNRLHGCAEQREDGEKTRDTLVPQGRVGVPLTAGPVYEGNQVELEHKKTLSVGVCAMDVKVNEQSFERLELTVGWRSGAITGCRVSSKLV